MLFHKISLLTFVQRLHGIFLELMLQVLAQPVEKTVRRTVNACFSTCLMHYETLLR